MAEQAHELESARDLAELQNENFEYGNVVLEIAIVLGSVAVITLSPLLLGIALAGGALGTLVMLNGFLQFFHPPWF